MSRVIKLMETRGHVVIFYRTNVAIIAALRIAFHFFFFIYLCDIFDNDDDMIRLEIQLLYTSARSNYNICIYMTYLISNYSIKTCNRLLRI